MGAAGDEEGFVKPMPTHRLSLRDVSGGYRSKEILSGISLGVAAGEILGLFGPNGAGKSTVLKTIIGILTPSTGVVELDGLDISSLAVHERVRAGIGYLTQETGVFPSLSVLENLALSSGLLEKNARWEPISAALEQFPELNPHRHRSAGLLSGGQRQILALATVFVKRPHVLLLDEPSAGLSPGLARRTLERVRTLSRSAGTTVLLVEQRVREALMFVDRGAFLHGGRIIAETEDPESWTTEASIEGLFLKTMKQQTEISTLEI